MIMLQISIAFGIGSVGTGASEPQINSLILCAGKLCPCVSLIGYVRVMDLPSVIRNFGCNLLTITEGWRQKVSMAEKELLRNMIWF